MNSPETIMVHCCKCDYDNHDVICNGRYICPECNAQFAELDNQCIYCGFHHTKQQGDDKCDRDECGGLDGQILKQVNKDD